MFKFLMLGHSMQLVRGGASCVCGARGCVTEVVCRATTAKGDLCVAAQGCLLTWRALVGFSHEARRVTRKTSIHSRWRTRKERNRWTFCNMAISHLEVEDLVREELAMRAFAHTQDPGG